MESKKAATRNPIKLFQRKTSYIEKHRIYELFQELSMMLLIKKPKDHVLFLKQSVYHAARRLDVPRIIILSPPSFDCSDLAQSLKRTLNIPTITSMELTGGKASISQRKLIDCLRSMLSNHMNYGFDGWIFFDFPRNEEEAKWLLRNGIIPSHVFEIVMPDDYSETSTTTSSHRRAMEEYSKEIRRFRNVFAKMLIKINIKNHPLEGIPEKCLKLIKYRQYSSLSLLRVLYIDFDSKKCKCIAKRVAKEFDIMHIDFKEVLKQVSLRDSELSYTVRDMLSLYKSDGVPTDIKVRVFEEFLLKSEAVKKGWILTGFVFTVDDMKALDMTDFTPNRIIIVEYEEEKPCSDTSSSAVSDELSCHCENNICDITSYVGESAHVIKGTDDTETIERQVNFWLARPAPCVPPRKPRPPPVIKPEDVEFDPDDEPDVGIFDCIREPEVNLTLV